MRIRQLMGSLVKVAILAAIAYAVLHWRSIGDADDDRAVFAQNACIDRAKSRYDVSSARVYETTKNSNGYVVRITVNLSRGTTAKVTCLANAHGGVRDITIDER